MTYHEHGYRGMWSISIATVDHTPDIEVPDTVDKDLAHEALREPHCTEGTSEHERRASR
jgi:hypothetical protein